MLTNKNIVIGVSGGIAAYKVCGLVSSLKKLNANVNVIMTKNATKFVAPLTFESLSNNPVVTDMFERVKNWDVEHVSLAKKADIFLVAPATANVIGKIANGIADDMLTTTVMACKATKIIAPAMNTAMYENQFFAANLDKLRNAGYIIVDSVTGRLACGDVGKGKMAEPDILLETILQQLNIKNDYKNKKVLITAGGTVEAIDAVRSITNNSSGKMGCALAQAAANRGADVTLVLARHSCVVPSNVKVFNVNTAAQMYDAVLNQVDANDIVIKAAAVADYFLPNAENRKIKDEKLQLNLQATKDIAAEVGKIKGQKKLVIFSAESENIVDNSLIKLKKKNADLVIANDITQKDSGFDSDDNTVILIDKQAVVHLEKMKKTQLAHIILDKVLTL